MNENFNEEIMDNVNEEALDIVEERSIGGMNGYLTAGIVVAATYATWMLYKKVIRPAIWRRKDKKLKSEPAWSYEDEVEVIDDENDDVLKSEEKE